MEIGLCIEFWIHFEVLDSFGEFRHAVEGEDSEAALFSFGFAEQVPSLVEEFQAIGLDEGGIGFGVAELLIAHL